MLAPDLDRYYTPAPLAAEMVGAIGIHDPVGYLDSACGQGRLLEAAQAAHPSARILGIDSDRQVIRRLRRRWPAWTLKTADALIESTWQRVAAEEPEVALLNPPFSMGTGKGVIVYLGTSNTLRCSVAMAHLLRVCEHARPASIVAIVPESLFFSDLDRSARRTVRARYSLEIVRGVRNSTFSGARANALVVRLQRRAAARRMPDAPLEVAFPDLVRGGLPLFEARTRNDGIPLVHSTDLQDIVDRGLSASARRVRSIGRGVVSGHVLLLPRVGVPNQDQVRPVYLRRRVQLSDCVIAYHGKDEDTCERVAEVILNEWRSFRGLYRGTGARYVTMARLGRWFARAMA